VSVARVDAQCQMWQQGDIFAGTGVPILRIVSKEIPLTEDPGGTRGRVAAEEFDRVAIVSQTCNIVRSYADRPQVTIAPIIELSGDVAKNAAQRRIPRYAPLPGAGSMSFVDLDQLTTVEKSVLVDRFVTPGCATDDDLRRFSQAVARHFARFAFPDEFNAMLRPLATTFTKRAGKNRAEGRRVDEVSEVRVRATPSWTSDEVDIELIFVVEPESLPPADQDRLPTPSARTSVGAICEGLDTESNPDERVALWTELVTLWTEQCRPIAPFASIAATVGTLDEMTAAHYLATDALDLDHLSDG
jgi:hypothetical protein